MVVLGICVKVLLIAKGVNVDLSIEIEPWKPTVFVGMNSTLKSYIARTFIDVKPNLYDIAEVSISPENMVCDDSGNAVCLYLEDFRLALRKLLTTTSDIEQLIEDIHTLRDSIKTKLEADPLVNLAERIEVRIKRIKDEILLGILNNYCRLKLLANLKVFCILQQVFENTLNSLAQRLKEVFDGVNEIDKNNIYPLQVDVVCGSPDIKIRVADTRLSTIYSIDSGFVSSSIASVLMVEIVTIFLSIATQRKYKVLVIEEPEEAMAPLQQVLFAMFIDEAIAKLKDVLPSNTYIILSTHSPYIASGFTNPNTYYFYYDTKNRKFTAAKRPPSRPFVFAEALLALAGEHRETTG